MLCVIVCVGSRYLYMSQVSFEDPFKFMHAFLPRNCICFAFKMFILKTVHTEIY